ncbi:hypothetical protein VTK26DRAFT_3632 [Humicola hyalothermophila]
MSASVPCSATSVPSRIPSLSFPVLRVPVSLAFHLLVSYPLAHGCNNHQVNPLRRNRERRELVTTCRQASSNLWPSPKSLSERPSLVTVADLYLVPIVGPQHVEPGGYQTETETERMRKIRCLSASTRRRLGTRGRAERGPARATHSSSPSAGRLRARRGRGAGGGKWQVGGWLCSPPNPSGPNICP